jgi:hypothetical protein
LGKIYISFTSTEKTNTDKNQRKEEEKTAFCGGFLISCFAPINPMLLEEHGGSSASGFFSYGASVPVRYRPFYQSGGKHEREVRDQNSRKE